MSQEFQQTVGVQPAKAVAGDFADTNPRASVSAGPGGLVAGPGGITVGLFAWFDVSTGAPTDDEGTPTRVINSGSGAPAGILHREQQGLNAVYLQRASMLVPAGFAVTLMSECGIWVKTVGAATRGQKAFAKNADGTISFHAAGASVAGSTETKFVAMSSGADGELVKMSSHALG